MIARFRKYHRVITRCAYRPLYPRKRTLPILTFLQRRRPTGRPGPPVPTVLKRDVPHHTANSVISVNGTATRPR